MRKVKLFVVFVMLINQLGKISAESDDDDDSPKIDDEKFFDFFGQQEYYFIEILMNMDLFTKPCDDFYQHVCGDFNEMNPMAPGKVGHGTIYKMTESINEDLHKVLSFIGSGDLENSTLVNTAELRERLKNSDDVALKAGAFYRSCLSADVFNFSKSDVYSDLIESLGGMPILDSNWTAENFDLSKVIATLRLYGSLVFINEYATEKYVYVKKAADFGLLPISFEDLNKISSKMYNVNKNLMKHLLMTYGADETESIDAIDDIFEFGKMFLNKIQHIPPSQDKYKNVSYLVKYYPHIDWIQYFSILFGKPIDPNFKVIISDLNYFEDILWLFSHRYKKTIANYLMLKLLFELHAELKSAQYPQIFCVKQSQKWLKPVPNLMYIESAYNDDSPEDKVAAMVEDIKSVFKDSIEEADWLNESTKAAAIAKLLAMQVLVGSKNISVDLKTFDVFYKNLAITTDNYHQNNLNVRRFKTEYKHNLLGEHQSVRTKVDIEVNAQYRVNFNELDLPAGILQEPMYHPNMPAAYNFASIGANIIGHEIVHGFDSIGRHFDSRGRESNWWSPKSNEEFEKRAQCFVDQYDSYVIESLRLHVNGTNTLAENIADNGGLRLGFYAYKKWLENNKENDVIYITFLKYTNVQFYFLSFAHASCSEFKRKGLLRIAEDVHTADKFRVNGPVSNFDEFANAFNCPDGSPMNPTQKCVLW